MKLLLVQPPVQDFYDTDVRLQPIGLAYLKAAVNKHLPEVDVIIKDYHAGCGRRTVAIPQELLYLKDYYSVADKLTDFTERTHSISTKGPTRFQ